MEHFTKSEAPTASELEFRTVVSGIDGSPEALEAATQALRLGAEGATGQTWPVVIARAC